VHFVSRYYYILQRDLTAYTMLWAFWIFSGALGSLSGSCSPTPERSGIRSESRNIS
jgi:predicted branched-subunit amino acid permease